MVTLKKRVGVAVALVGLNLIMAAIIYSNAGAEENEIFSVCATTPPGQETHCNCVFANPQPTNICSVSGIGDACTRDRDCKGPVEEF